MQRYRIFISYRRDDTRHFVSRLRATFGKELPDDLAFFDRDSIDGGVGFQQAITQAIAESAVVVVVIATEWLNPHNRSRLRAPDDPVRAEIETALRLGKTVLPLLVDDAAMPRPQELPPSIRGLHEKHAARIRSDVYDDDADRLVRVIDGLITQAVPDRRVSSGVTFPDTGESASTYLNLMIAGIAIPLFVWFAFRVHGELRELLSVLFGGSVIAGHFYFRSSNDRLVIDVGGIEVRKVGIVHRFPWSEIDRIDTHATKKNVFLVARRAGEQLCEEYARADSWPRWDNSSGYLIICDLKVEARRGGGKDGSSFTFTTDRYSGGTDSKVLDAVKRYRPIGGFGGLRPPPAMFPGRDAQQHPWIGVVAAVALAIVVTIIALSVARSTDSPSSSNRIFGFPAVHISGAAPAITGYSRNPSIVVPQY
ncbi:toll/interleukin-1 receptor domain-containing protein [Nocardia asteroides]|uniref:toll/interleukin-1 receptor domain-containing protein n=1 Tax=Nocardia asteroides TaxID=1824 RepID=UPI00379518A1